MVPIESRDSEGVAFANLERLWPDIRQTRVPKSGHVTITKIENLHIVTRRKIHWFQKCHSFRSTTKNNEVIVENRFRTVALPGACERLAVLNWRSSSIHPSSIMLVITSCRLCTCTPSCLKHFWFNLQVVKGCRSSRCLILVYAGPVQSLLYSRQPYTVYIRLSILYLPFGSVCRSVCQRSNWTSRHVVRETIDEPRPTWFYIVGEFYWIYPPVVTLWV